MNTTIKEEIMKKYGMNAFDRSKKFNETFKSVFKLEALLFLA
jgi:hypothetical protein